MDDQRFNFIKQSSAQSAQIFARLLDWLIEEPHGGMAPLVLAWYVALCAVAVLNPVLLARAHRRSPIDRADRARANYQRLMLGLAVPMVVECAWRSVFPSLYLQRFTFWDTPLNSIIVDRSLACVGEITWTAQIALAVAHVDAELTGGRCWVRLASVGAVLTYVVAEGISYYNTATTNEWWAAAEVAVDALSWVLLFPAALSLACRLRAVPGWTSGKVFVYVFTVMALVYPLYNFCVDCPMYLKRYEADEAAGKQYFKFLPGLADAAARRVPTRALADWQGDMFWMAAYFGPAAWSSILLVAAPTTRPPRAETASAASEESASRYVSQRMLSYA